MELKLMRVADIVLLFKVSRKTVHNWQKAGKIHGKRINRLVFFEASEVKALLEDDISPRNEQIDNPDKTGGLR